MIKTVLMLVAMLSLPGCIYQTINTFDIFRATQLCSGIENVVEIHSNFVGVEHVICKDGKYLRLSEYKGATNG